MRGLRGRICCCGFAATAAILLSAFAVPAVAESPPEPAMTQSQDTTEADGVEQRLTDSLSAEMRANFNLFIYFDKAEQGPLAQHMYVFEKTDLGDLALLYDWPVSTGREAAETDPNGQPEST